MEHFVSGRASAPILNHFEHCSKVNGLVQDSALDDVIKDSRLEAVLQDILYNVRDAEGKAVENIRAEQLALK